MLAAPQPGPSRVPCAFQIEQRASTRSFPCFFRSSPDIARLCQIRPIPPWHPRTALYRGWPRRQRHRAGLSLLLVAVVPNANGSWRLAIAQQPLRPHPAQRHPGHLRSWTARTPPSIDVPRCHDLNPCYDRCTSAEPRFNLVVCHSPFYRSCPTTQRRQGPVFRPGSAASSTVAVR